ncbi:MAG: hypothetical protein HYV23_08260, partial [Deltaproteobacteria bacterium]|nr:hypothetical protein [Deltaproteobacteria bacterium]
MKTLKTLWFVPLMLSFVLATGAFAREYGKSGAMTQPMRQPQAQMTQPQAMPLPGSGQIGSGQLGQGEGVYYFGSLTSIDPANNQLIVNTEVPGLLGPQSADVAFNTSSDTTMSICFKSLNSCDTYFTDREGWNALNNLQNISSLSAANKQVIVIGNPETSEVV